MSVFLCIMILIIILFSVQWKFGISGNTDVYKNNGAFKVSLFGIPLFGFFVCLGCGKNGESSILLTVGPKTKELHLNRKKDDKDSLMSQKVPPLFSNLLLENLKVHVSAGSYDAFATVMFLGSIRVLFESLFGYLRSRQNIAIEGRFIPIYNTEVFRIFVSGILSISLADIIYSLISALFKHIKEAIK